MATATIEGICGVDDAGEPCMDLLRRYQPRRMT
jgi:hypothetical protein